MINEHLQVKVTQKALITIDGKVLMVLEGKDWELPGGRVDQGETDLKAAFTRELEEELSIHVNPKSIYTVNLFTRPSGELALAIVYECNLLNTIDAIKPRPGEIDDWKLFSKEELRELRNIYPNSSEAIVKYLYTD